MAKLMDLVISITGEVGGLKSSLAQARSEINKTARDLDRQAASVNRLGSGMTRSLTLPIVAFGVAAGRSTLEFQKQMNRVKALTGATNGELSGLNKQALKLGDTTKFSATQAADAMGFLAQSGNNAQEIMAMMPATLNLAAAANTDIASTADMATNIMKTFGLEMNKTSHAADVLATVTSGYNTDLLQLAEAVKYGGAQSKLMNMSLEETSAIMGVLANAGLQGSIGGTALSAALTKVIGQSKATKNAVKNLGLQLNDSNGKFVGMLDILGQLEGKQVAVEDLLAAFGKKGIRVIGAFAETSVEATKALVTAMENGDKAGVAANIATIQLEGLVGSWTRLMSVVSTGMTKFGQSISKSTLIPVLDGATSAISFLSRNWMVLDGAMKSNIATGAAVAAALGPVLIVVSKLMGIVPRLVMGMNPLTKALLGVSVAWAAFGDKIKPVISEILPVLQQFGNIWIGIFKTIGESTARFVIAVSKMWETLKKAVGGVLESIGIYIDKMVATVTNAFGALNNAIRSKLQPVITYVADVMMAIGDKVEAADLKGAFVKELAPLPQVVSAVLGKTAESVDKEGNKVVVQTETVTESIQRALEDLSVKGGSLSKSAGKSVFGELSAGAVEVGTDIDGFTQSLEELAPAMEVTTGLATKAAAQTKEVAKATKEAEKEAKKHASQVKKNVREYENLVAQALKADKDAQDKREAIWRLEMEAWQRKQDAINDYKRSIGAIPEHNLVSHAQKIKLLKEAWADGVISVDKYLEELEKLEQLSPAMQRHLKMFESVGETIGNLPTDVFDAMIDNVGKDGSWSKSVKESIKASITDGLKDIAKSAFQTYISDPIKDAIIDAIKKAFADKVVTSAISAAFGSGGGGGFSWGDAIGAAVSAYNGSSGGGSGGGGWMNSASSAWSAYKAYGAATGGGAAASGGAVVGASGTAGGAGAAGVSAGTGVASTSGTTAASSGAATGMSAAGGVFTAFAAALVWYNKKSGEARKSTKAWNRLLEKGAPVEKTVNGIRVIGEESGRVFLRLGDDTGYAMEQLRRNLNGGVQVVSDGVVSIKGDMEHMLEHVQGPVSRNWMQFAYGLRQGMSDAGKFIEVEFEGSMDQVGEVLAGMQQTAGGTFQLMQNEYGATVARITGDTQTWANTIDQAFNKTGDGAKGLFDNMKDGYANLKERLEEAINVQVIGSGILSGTPDDRDQARTQQQNAQDGGNTRNQNKIANTGTGNAASEKRNGGFVGSDGLMYLHAGEFVLSKKHRSELGETFNKVDALADAVATMSSGDGGSVHVVEAIERLTREVRRGNA